MAGPAPVGYGHHRHAHSARHRFGHAAIFGLLAMRSSPSHAEQEARRVRQQALDAARGSFLLTAAVPTTIRLLGFGRRRSWFPFGRR